MMPFLLAFCFLFFIESIYPQNPGKIVCLGSSSTAAIYLPYEYRWSSILSDSLNVEVVNRGLSGGCTWDFLQEPRMSTWKADSGKYYIIAFGLNGETHGNFRDNTLQLIYEVRSIGAVPILMTNQKVDYPTHHSWNRNPSIIAIDTIKRNIAIEQNVHLIDLWQRVENELNSGNWDLYIRNHSQCPNNDNFSPHPNHNSNQHVINSLQDNYPNHISLGAAWFTDSHPSAKGTKIFADEIIKYFRENIFVQQISLNLKVFLEGPFNQNSMSLSLNSNGFIPLEQPYNNSVFNYDGTESVTSVPENVVDWILIELRDSVSASSVRGRRACFVTSNGNVVDLDGTSLPEFNLPSGNYYVVVRHRNHLPVMSATEVFLSNSSQLYDFSIGNNMAYGNNPLVELAPGIYGMPAGDGSGNGIINVLDYGKVANQISTNGYKTGDYDLNGVVNILDYSKTGKNLFKVGYVPN